MRQIGTSHGQAGGFGPGTEDASNSGPRQHSDGGDARTRQGGAGLRRDGRDGALRDGASRDGTQTREADPHVRAFQDRMEAARRRTGQGRAHEHDQDGEERAGADLPGMLLPLQHAAETDLAPASASAEGAPERSRHRSGSEPAASAADPSRTDRREGSSEAPADRPSAPPAKPGHDTRDPGQRRLLAEAGPPGDALVALFTPRAAVASPGPAADAPAGTASIEARVADIAVRVEQSLAADLGAGAGAPVSLRVPIDEAAGGVASLTVTASAEGVDIVLNRASGEPAPSADLVEAAQGLAERLQRRLGRGAVRVFEGTDAASGPAEAAGSDAGWAGLSALLARRQGDA